jgi:hypothetical protein
MAKSCVFRYLLLPPLVVVSLASGQTGIKEKKPVFGGACRLCPGSHFGSGASGDETLRIRRADLL